MALRPMFGGSKKPIKHILKPNDTHTSLVCSFIKDCIKDMYTEVFVNITEKYFELQILDGKLDFITDVELKKVLESFIKTKTSIGSVLSHQFSIDRIDKTIVRTIGSETESHGWIFKIKWNQEFQQLHMTHHPEMWESGTPNIEDAR